MGAQGANAAEPPVSPKEMLRGMRPSFGLVGVLLLAYLLAGTAAFYLAMDHMSGDRTGSCMLDALYFCVVTMMTVEYGDLVPASDAAKLLAFYCVCATAYLEAQALLRSFDAVVNHLQAALNAKNAAVAALQRDHEALEDGAGRRGAKPARSARRAGRGQRRPQVLDYEDRG